MTRDVDWLIAPDSFKGTRSAREVAVAIARGICGGESAEAIELCPVADGGEGTIEAVVQALGLRVVAEPAHDPLARDPRGMPMSGSGGGLAGALWARYDARIVPGAAWVLDALGFDQRLQRARAVITGEGRLDAQTLEGKAIAEIARRCARARIPVHAVVGSIALDDAGSERLGLASVRRASDLGELESAGRALATAACSA